MKYDDEPTLRVLSLGAGVQSTTVLMLSAEGRLPKLDLAIFADTGWEPRGVYDHLDRLEREIAGPAGIPIRRVATGNIRNDALDPDHRFASMPLHVLNPDGSHGLTRRQCTSEYKLKPIKAEVRRELGAEWTSARCRGCDGSGFDQHNRLCPNCEGGGHTGRWGRPPSGRWVEQWIGISLDEMHRARDSDVRYARNCFPLLDLRWSREDCLRYLRGRGWESTPKSACIGCPFHRNAAWRRLRDTDPEGWADAVNFDEAIRRGSARANMTGSDLRGNAFLHFSLRPLGEANIDRVSSHEWNSRQTNLLDAIADDEADAPGCSPFACERTPEVGHDGEGAA